jgi:hypothetical protein
MKKQFITEAERMQKLAGISIHEYFDKDSLRNQAYDVDQDLEYSFSADFDDSNLENDQREYLKKLAWVLKQKGASDQEIKNIFKNSKLLSKRDSKTSKSYRDLYDQVKNWTKKNIKVK